MAKRAYDTSLDVTRKELMAFRPSEVQVDWRRNTSRAAIYSFEGRPCSYRPEDVEDLVLPVAALATIAAGGVDDIPALIAEHAGPVSMLRMGQTDPITVFFNGKKHPVVAAGYRRMFAFLLMEQHGLLDHVPVAHGRAGAGKIEALVIEQPLDPDGWLRVAGANLAENAKKPASPIDIAWALRRLALPAADGGEFGLGPKEAGIRVSSLLGAPLATRSVARYLQLLSLPMDLQASLHRGEVTMAAALQRASEEGHGRATGSRSSVKHSVLRRIPRGTLEKVVARRRPSDDRLISAAEVELYTLWIAGEDVTPPSWGPALLEASEEAALAAKTTKRKKAPPKPKKGAA